MSEDHPGETAWKIWTIYTSCGGNNLRKFKQWMKCSKGQIQQVSSTCGCQCLVIPSLGQVMGSNQGLNWSYTSQYSKGVQVGAKGMAIEVTVISHIAIF